jgi:hypothetical protein
LSPPDASVVYDDPAADKHVSATAAGDTPMAEPTTRRFRSFLAFAAGPVVIIALLLIPLTAAVQRVRDAAGKSADL